MALFLLQATHLEWSWDLRGSEGRPRGGHPHDCSLEMGRGMQGSRSVSWLLYPGWLYTLPTERHRPHSQFASQSLVSNFPKSMQKR